MVIRGFTIVAIRGFTWWPSEDSHGGHLRIQIVAIWGFTWWPSDDSHIDHPWIQHNGYSSATTTALHSQPFFCAIGILPRMYARTHGAILSDLAQFRKMCTISLYRTDVIVHAHSHTSCHIYKPHRQSYRLRPRGTVNLIGTLRKKTTTCVFDWVLHDSEIHTFELFLWTDWSYKNMWNIGRRQSSRIIMACIAVHERRIWPCYAPRSPLHYYMRWSPEVSNTKCEISETQPTGWDPN